MKKTLIFVASLNMNVVLANSLKKQLSDLEVDSEIIDLVNLNLPMYDSEKEEKDGIPKEVYPLIEKMKEIDNFVFVSPEYNFSLPPVLVNFIAWISRDGDNFRELFAMKKIQLATHSGGGGQDVLNAMRNQFTRLGSIVMPREVLTTYQNPLREDSSLKILKQFIQEAK